MPIDYSKYPPDWKAISKRIRFGRAQNKCEACGAANYQPHPVTGSKVILTVAHLNHIVTDNRDENLMAMCQKCHNSFDAKHRAESRRRKQMKLYHVVINTRTQYKMTVYAENEAVAEQLADYSFQNEQCDPTGETIEEFDVMRSETSSENHFLDARTYDIVKPDWRKHKEWLVTHDCPYCNGDIEDVKRGEESGWRICPHCDEVID